MTIDQMTSNYRCIEKVKSLKNKMSGKCHQKGPEFVGLRTSSRPALSQLWRLKIRRKTFLNYIKLLTDLQAMTVLIHRFTLDKLYPNQYSRVVRGSSLYVVCEYKLSNYLLLEPCLIDVSVNFQWKCISLRLLPFEAKLII